MKSQKKQPVRISSEKSNPLIPFPELDEKRRWFCAGFLYASSRNPKADLPNFARALDLPVMDVVQVESTLGYTLDSAMMKWKAIMPSKPNIIIARG